MQIPEYETERLRLRGHTLEDYSQCCALWADPQVVRFIGGKALTTEETWHRMLRYRGHWEMLRFGFWLIEEKSTGEFVGEAGLFDSEREMEPPIGPEPEMGWVLASAKHGRGYATEVVRGLLAWGARHLDAPQVACLIDPENVMSLRVAEKCGFAISHSAVYCNRTVQVLRAPLKSADQRAHHDPALLPAGQRDPPG